MIYLDYAASTPINQEVLTSYFKLLENYYANAASLHNAGIKANNFLSSARESIAKLLKVDYSSIIFTSGATEANNLAIFGYLDANRRKGKRIITSKVEHPSVLNCFKKLEERYEVIYLDVDEKGRVKTSELEKYINEDTALVSIMAVNNEVGAINDLKKISEIVHRYDCAFHSDITQAIGKIDVDFSLLDMASFSSHKLYAPKGSGIFYKKDEIKVNPINIGGGQEFTLRSGTSNWPTNVALAKALRLLMEAKEENYKYVSELWDLLNEGFKDTPNLFINSYKGNSPYIFNFSISVLTGEVLVHSLEEEGYLVSTISACGSKVSRGSYVIKSMNGDDLLSSNSIRVSLSHLVSKEDVLGFIEAVKKILKKG